MYVYSLYIIMIMFVYAHYAYVFVFGPRPGTRIGAAAPPGYGVLGVGGGDMGLGGYIGFSQI